jgi:hypothetical protein
MLCCLATTGALADDVDLSLKDIPQPAEIAPAPAYTADVDATQPQGSKTGLGFTDAVARQVECDITTGGSTTSDYVALILDRDATDNLFIKIQQQSGGGTFDHIGFYTGNNGSGWAGMTGGPAFNTLAAADQFASAHMIVIHDGSGNVTLRLTNIDGTGKVLGFSRGGWTPRNSASTGFGGWTGNYPVDNFGRGSPTDWVCDDFDRANGPLGANWVTTDGTGSIVSNAARGNSFSRSIYVGSCASGPVHSVEADVTIIGTGLDYCALVLDYNGSNNLFVKLQQQNGGSGIFDHIGFYQGNNGSAWPGQTGGSSFFTIPVDQQFSTGHMKVQVDPSGTVRLIITNINGGSGAQEYQRGGWTVLNGNEAGFGGYAGNNVIDNLGIDDHGVCDNFNRPDGPLGGNWLTDAGSASIVNNAASGSSLSRSVFVGICGTCLDGTQPLVSLTGPTTLSCICGIVNITGSVSDPDGDYADDVLEYRAAGAAVWTLAGSASGARSGILYVWNTGALPEGWYSVRVTGRNACNLTNNDSTFVFISRNFDTVDVRGPLDGAILGGFVCPDGTAWDSNCFSNYTVMYKPSVGGAFAPVDPAHPSYTTPVMTDPLGSWNTPSGPTAVPDGDYQIRVRGTDGCGNVAQVIRNVTIDNTAPVALLSSTLTCRTVGGVVPIIGTATDAHLSAWALQYTGGDAHNWVTIATGNSSVNNALLANWNTVGLRPCAYVLRLVVADSASVNCSGNTHQTDYYVGVGIGFGLRGDMDCNGVVNFDDINGFVACLSGNCDCP